jgi:ribosomal protein S18 acetylase RimI-like enzyme
MDVQIITCNLSEPKHRNQLVALISAYMADTMGGSQHMPGFVAENLPQVLASHPSNMILFALVNGQYAGIITCFINISTFVAKPYFNVHDIVVLPQYRANGIGRALLNKVIEIARERGYCKVNLEVRADNEQARHLYASLGFADTEPPMLFWTKWL